MLIPKQLIRTQGPFIYHKVMIDLEEDFNSFSFLETRYYASIGAVALDLGENFLDDLKINSCQEVDDCMHFLLELENISKTPVLGGKVTEEELGLFAYCINYAPNNFRIKWVDPNWEYLSNDFICYGRGLLPIDIIGPRTILAVAPPRTRSGSLTKAHKALLKNSNGKYSYKVLDAIRGSVSEVDLYYKFVKLMNALTLKQLRHDKNRDQQSLDFYRHIKELRILTKGSIGLLKAKGYFEEFKKLFPSEFAEMYKGWKL